MTINKETEAEILRLYNAEGWRRNTIARQLGIHHSSIDRVLNRNGVPVKPTRTRKVKVDKYLPFIEKTLEKYPKLNATRLFHMVKERGYSGGVDHFRDIVARLRPAPKGEAYLRLATLPGEQAQCDWAHFGKLKVGNAERRLLAFVLVLSWSRRIFLRFYFGDSTANFLRGHADAFEQWQAVPREILYDNLKSAVLERSGDAIHFNPDLLSLAAHYRFAPKPVPVRRANEKGRVERAIRYVRSNFFAGREFKDIHDLNRQAQEWCTSEARERACPQDRSLTVQAAFEQEKTNMLPLPLAPFPVYDRKIIKIGKTPYARFDLNDYSVPHTFAYRDLVLEATLETVSLSDGSQIVAVHDRSFNKGQQIEDPDHIRDLWERKHESRKHRALDRLRWVAPSAEQFFLRAAERGSNLGRLTQTLTRLLDLYGASEIEAALDEALQRGLIHSNAIQEILERRRGAKGLPPPVPMQFSQRAISELRVVPKNLDKYNNLINKKEKN
jgi:transposase